MKIRALALVALAVVLPLSAAACGKSDSGSGSGGGANSEAPALKDLSKKLQEGGMKKAQADCVAKAFADADISEADIAKLEKGDTSGLDSATFQRYTRSIASCITTTTGG